MYSLDFVWDLATDSANTDNLLEVLESMDSDEFTIHQSESAWYT